MINFTLHRYGIAFSRHIIIHVVRTPVTPLLLSSTSNIEKLPFGKPSNQYGRHSYNRHSTVNCHPTVIVRSLVLGHCIVIQLSWYVHSSSKRHFTFISHSPFNQWGHLLCNRHGMSIRHPTIIIRSSVTPLLISVVICHTTVIIRSSVTPLLISEVICYATVMVCSFGI
jgi:hypothetical protein